ncbi:LAMI_0G03686g1_1 [Lachancea mirantina]|uniref:F-actin-capping protein subunit alpha n=1 Tax=Lachancea mirantina TaxID=1230905 RepID=A0A1G4K873_9SACH|nr:LAMI_0G03686g1_1 [Lachancea mirantina]
MTDQLDAIVSDIVSNSPSGEISEVVKDLKVIIGESGEEAIKAAVEKYNIANWIPIKLGSESVIVSDFNKSGTKFYDPKSSQLFSVDHLKRLALDVQPCDKELKANELAIYNDLDSYVKNSFANETSCAVYPGESANEIVLIIVGTKYSPANFWNGQWKSFYRFNTQSKQLSGSIHVRIHYFEEGNVNFSNDKDVKAENVDDVASAIKDLEDNWEQEMEKDFFNLNEKEFKLLRRRLPVTRSKINWGKGIGNYRIGKDSAASQ